MPRPTSEWTWLERRDAEAVHERLLLLNGGAPGLRDAGLLESALARPRQLAAYDPAADAAALAAAYAHGVIRNHPFVDGNKRTGFLLGVLFLELNGRRFVASEEATTAAVTSLADGSLDQGGYAAFVRENLG